MSITENMRKAFDACTVMAGVEPDFECVYMTKDAALLYLDEIDAENAKLREQVDAAHMSRLLTENENESLRELVRHMHTCMEHYEMDGTISCDRCPLDNCVGNCDYERRMRELGVEVDG